LQLPKVIPKISISSYINKENEMMIISRGLFLVSFAAAELLVGCGGGGSNNSDDIAISVAPSTTSTDSDMSIYAFTDQAQIDSRQQALIEERLKTEDQNGPRFYQMIKDLGGFAAFNNLIASGEKEKIEATLSKYGIGYSASEPGASQSSSSTLSKNLSNENGSANQATKPLAITDCVPFFPPADRGKTFALGSHTVYIDAMGRPAYATWIGSPSDPVVPGTRTPCATTVGTWGIAGDQGGHLIPTALGGWGGRANIVPQNGSMNMGPWKIIESIPSICSKRWTTTYIVTPGYASPLDVRPARFDLTITVLILGVLPLTAAAAGMPNIEASPGMYAAAYGLKNGVVGTAGMCSI
jgi:DNA/RNA non-specific endonuclease